MLAIVLEGNLCRIDTILIYHSLSSTQKSGG
nr:MAG TPA: hypothetical protein [Caudoviricetes sp.]